MALAAGGLLAASAAQAADEEVVLRARAVELASRGDCAGALPLLDQANRFDEGAGDRAADLMRGRCLVDLGRFEEARTSLERAVVSEPESGEAALALGIARYEVGDADGAYAELERAERLLPSRPEPPLYLGLILIDREENAQAASLFERSNQLNSDDFEPISGYYAAVAHAGAGDVESSEAALRRVQERGAGTVWGDRATELLASADARRSNPPLASWLRFQVGIDYDTNVSLRGDRVTQPGNISSDDDFRGWWAVDGGTEVLRKDGWALGVGGRYSGYEYFEQQSFRQHFLTGRTWLDRSLGDKTLLRISPEVGFGFFDTAEYLRFYGVRPEIRQDWGEAGVGTFYARYAYNDFRELFNTPSSAVDRDGHDVRAGYDHLLPVSEKTTLKGGVFGRYYDSEGSEYDHAGGGGWLGITQVLPWRMTLNASGSVAYDSYDGASFFLQPGERVRDREDIIGTAVAELSRPLTNWLSVAARYQYLNNESNTRVFDYDRHLAGIYFTLDVLGLF